MKKSVKQNCAGLAILWLVANGVGASWAQEANVHVGVLGTWSISSDSALSPIASVEEVAKFRGDYSSIIAEAEKGSLLDRWATSQILMERLQATRQSLGTKRLLGIAAMRLAIHSSGTSVEVTRIADTVMPLLDGNSAPLVTERIGLMMALNGAAKAASGPYGPAAIANQYFLLSEIQIAIGQDAAARESFEAGRTWAAKDSDYFKRQKPAVDAYQAMLKTQADLGLILSTKSNDPSANRNKGLFLIVQRLNAAEAAEFLLKSNVPELERLGKALRVPESSSARVEVASAAAGALKVVPVDVRSTLANLIANQVRLVEKDPTAAESDKTRASLARLKAEQFFASEPLPRVLAQAGNGGFFGIEVTASKVVYIIDHSGSMLENFELLKTEVRRSGNALGPAQSFGIVMFSEKAEVLNGGTLAQLEADRKKMFAEMDRFTAQGKNNDALSPFLDAFQKAIAMKPDCIIFLTDGKFDPKLVKEVARLNALKKIQINTVAFVAEEPEYKRSMEQVARENFGVYRFVAEKDLKH